MKTNDVSDKTNAPNGPKKDIRSQLGGFDQNFQWERRSFGTELVSISGSYEENIFIKIIITIC